MKAPSFKTPLHRLQQRLQRVQLARFESNQRHLCLLNYRLVEQIRPRKQKQLIQNFIN